MILYLDVYSIDIENSIFIGLPCYSKSTPLVTKLSVPGWTRKIKQLGFGLINRQSGVVE